MFRDVGGGSMMEMWFSTNNLEQAEPRRVICLSVPGLLKEEITAASGVPREFDFLQMARACSRMPETMNHVAVMGSQSGDTANCLQENSAQ